LAKEKFQKPAESSTSVSSLPIEGKSRTELKELARQLMIQISQMGADNDDESPVVSLASSEASSSQAVKKNWEEHFYPDAQNPFKDLNAD
jgi:hypothetical protein